MRPTLPRLFAAAPPAPPPTHSRPLMALLPPIPLYRRLLRAHRRHLRDPDMRTMGDAYLKAEFRAHRKVDKPRHLIGFLTEWQLYAQTVEGEDWREGRIEQVKVDKMSDQQIGQLYELMTAIKTRNEGNEGGGGDDGGGGPPSSAA